MSSSMTSPACLIAVSGSPPPSSPLCNETLYPYADSEPRALQSRIPGFKPAVSFTSLATVFSCDWMVTVKQYISFIRAGGSCLSWTEMFGTLEMILQFKKKRERSTAGNCLTLLQSGPVCCCDCCSNTAMQGNRVEQKLFFSSIGLSGPLQSALLLPHLYSDLNCSNAR